MQHKARGISFKKAQVRTAEFWGRVDVTGECWLWDRPLVSAKGYGHFKISGRHEKAHRVAWTLSRRRDLPPKMHICHKCDNPACVNPNHLFICTHHDNMADKARKGRVRGPRGEAHHKNKLKKKQVIAIREMYATGHYTLKQLALMFGVDKSNVALIVNGRIWKNAGGPIKGRDYGPFARKP